MTLVWTFPGQSSRYPGMLNKFAGLSPASAQILQEACEITGTDLGALNASDQAYACNLNIQRAVFLANLMAQKALEAQGLAASYSLGLSLGEYNHLVHIGALSWQDALRLVGHRGQAYDQGPAGAMASIQPVSLEELAQLLGPRLGTPGSEGSLEIVNRNSPRQQVIAGDPAAVQAACDYLEQEHYLAPIIIERKIAMHSSGFASVGQQFAPALDEAEFLPPRLPYLPNVQAQFLRTPSAAQFRASLKAHVSSPVLWQKSIEFVLEELGEPVFVEVGPMGVLTGLLHRRWVKAPRFKLDVKEGIEAHFSGLVAALAPLSAQGPRPAANGAALEPRHV